MPNAVVRFATFALDPQRHVLTSDGADVPLSPHLVDILHFLAMRPGELVTKDVLLDRFWTDVHVSDNTLTRAIADIRKALGDDAATPTFIQTVARRGYRFVASAQVAGDSELAPELAAVPDPFREWVRGRFSLESLDAARLPAAVAAFEHAVAAAPTYAPAHAGLANACFLQYECTRAENQPSRDPLLRALEHARRACELDPSLGEAWATLGHVLLAVGQFEESGAAARRATALEASNWRHHFRLAMASWGEARLRACDRTLALLPDFAPAHFLSSMVFSARQAFTPALQSAEAGALAQERQASHGGAPFPSVGLHWLHGLLLLRQGSIGAAILAFAREIDEAQDARIYSAEFRVNAQIGAGFAHLAADDAAGATEAFRSALETQPRNGRALLGLYQALLRTSLAAESPRLLPQVDRAIAELTAGQRLGEAALVQAAAHAARGEIDAACLTLHRLLDQAPPGQVGWQIPIDPALAVLRGTPQFEIVTAALAARAS